MRVCELVRLIIPGWQDSQNWSTSTPGTRLPPGSRYSSWRKRSPLNSGPRESAVWLANKNNSCAVYEAWKGALPESGRNRTCKAATNTNSLITVKSGKVNFHSSVRSRGDLRNPSYSRDTQMGLLKRLQHQICCRQHLSRFILSLILILLEEYIRQTCDYVRHQNSLKMNECTWQN